LKERVRESKRPHEIKIETIRQTNIKVALERKTKFPKTMYMHIQTHTNTNINKHTSICKDKPIVEEGQSQMGKMRLKRPIVTRGHKFSIVQILIPVRPM